jgi:hypothetical protein
MKGKVAEMFELGRGIKVVRATMLELVLYALSKGGESAKVFMEADDMEILDFIHDIPVVEFVLPA